MKVRVLDYLEVSRRIYVVPLTLSGMADVKIDAFSRSRGAKRKTNLKVAHCWVRKTALCGRSGRFSVV